MRSKEEESKIRENVYKIQQIIQEAQSKIGELEDSDHLISSIKERVRLELLRVRVSLRIE